MGSKNNLQFSRKRRKQKKRKTIMLMFLIMVLLCTSFFIGSKVIRITKSVAEAADVGNEIGEKNEIKDNHQLSGELISFNIDRDIIEQKEEDINKNLIEELNKKNIIIESVEKKDNDSEKNNEDDNKEKVCYLTFDDGPTPNITPQILSVLDDYNIKATFFVIGQLAEQNDDVLKEVDKKGHYVANHTYSHNYNKIYVSPSAMIQDIEKCNEVLNKYIGKTTNIIRFPGGSFGKTNFQESVNNAGYNFVDWNCLNGDAEALNVPPERLMERIKETMYGQDSLVVLMHDAATKQTTVQALPKIIEYIKSQGYEFKTLDEAFE